jgi:hypothetical protein
VLERSSDGGAANTSWSSCETTGAPPLLLPQVPSRAAAPPAACTRELEVGDVRNKPDLGVSVFKRPRLSTFSLRVEEER